MYPHYYAKYVTADGRSIIMYHYEQDQESFVESESTVWTRVGVTSQPYHTRAAAEAELNQPREVPHEVVAE